MRPFIGALTGVFVLMLASAALGEPSPWASIAEGDLRAVHDILRENHPAVLVHRDGSP
jgi:hypothetical protein